MCVFVPINRNVNVPIELRCVVNVVVVVAVNGVATTTTMTTMCPRQRRAGCGNCCGNAESHCLVTLNMDVYMFWEWHSVSRAHYKGDPSWRCCVCIILYSVDLAGMHNYSILKLQQHLNGLEICYISWGINHTLYLMKSYVTLRAIILWKLN